MSALSVMKHGPWKTATTEILDNAGDYPHQQVYYFFDKSFPSRSPREQSQGL